MNDVTADAAAVLRPELLMAMLAAEGDVVVVTDEWGRVQWASPSLTWVLGWPVDSVSVIGPHLVHPDDAEEFSAAELAIHHRPGNHYLGTSRWLGADKQWHELEVTAINLLDDHGVVVRRLRDLANRPSRASQEHPTDEVTGLVGRTFTRADLEDRLANTSAKVAVLFLDLDGFKQVNDRYGHATGDRVLREVADRLGVRLRDPDLLARWGGDEFVVLVDVPGPALAINVAARLHGAVSERSYDVRGGSVALGVSIGVAFGERGDDAETIIAAADHAMYAAKRRGGGIVTAEESAA